MVHKIGKIGVGAPELSWVPFDFALLHSKQTSVPGVAKPQHNVRSSSTLKPSQLSKLQTVGLFLSVGLALN